MSKLSSRRETMLGFQPPAIGDEEVAAVIETLRSGWLTSGPSAALLEQGRARAAGEPAGAQRLGDGRDLLVADRRRLEAEHGFASRRELRHRPRTESSPPRD